MNGTMLNVVIPIPSVWAIRVCEVMFEPDTEEPSAVKILGHVPDGAALEIASVALNDWWKDEFEEDAEHDSFDGSYVLTTVTRTRGHYKDKHNDEFIPFLLEGDRGFRADHPFIEEVTMVEVEEA